MHNIGSFLALSLFTFARAKSLDVDSSYQPKSTKTVASAYYAGWHATDFPLSAVSWNKYTHMVYAFALPTSNNELSISQDDETLLPQFVADAHKNNVKALVSAGGWTGSGYFSSNIATAENRTAFVKTVVDFVKKYYLDGVDFDWEYPGSQGIGCNVVSPNDVPNFLAFLQELRTNEDAKKFYITAATPTVPWVGASGAHSTDLSGFAQVLDHIVIMNYDYYGAWSSTAGPNAPLNDTCAPPASQFGSAIAAIAAWRAAGIPARQLVLGVPYYGHSWTVTPASAYVNGTSGELAVFAPADKAQPPSGDSWDDPAGVDQCGNASGPGGIWEFWGLVKNGWLTAKGVAAPGVDYLFDTCSKTPLLYNRTSEIMISYDNARSFAAKGKLIKDTGLLGFSAWEAGGDYEDILLDSIRGALDCE